MHLGRRHGPHLPVSLGAVMFALVDANSFYCSCERVFNPALRDKPVVVLSNNDGIIIALTPEAKALGFKMGDTYFQNREVLDKNYVHVFSSNYALYGDMSRRVMQVIARFPAAPASTPPNSRGGASKLPF